MPNLSTALGLRKTLGIKKYKIRAERNNVERRDETEQYYKTEMMLQPKRN